MPSGVLTAATFAKGRATAVTWLNARGQPDHSVPAVVSGVMTWIVAAVSPLTTKGDIWAFGAGDDRFPVGSTDGMVLTVDSSGTFGMTWRSLGGSLASASAYAGTGVDDSTIGALPWINPGNATGAPDGAFATATNATAILSHYLLLTAYGLSVPATATVAGLKVTLRRTLNEFTGTPTPYPADNSLRLFLSGSPIGADLADTITNWPTAFGNADYGGVGNLWGYALTPTVVNDATFGVGLSITTPGVDSGTGNQYRLRVDSGQMTAYWRVRGALPFPQRATCWQDEALYTTGTASPQHDASQNYGTYTKTASPANGDTFTHGLYLDAGYYTLTVLGVTRNDAGKIDWSLDGASIATGQDWYSGSTTYNVRPTVTGVAVAASGWHVLQGVVNGKNGSSSGYAIPLTKVEMIPATDTAATI